MMAIFFSRPLTLTINSLDIVTEISPEKTDGKQVEREAERASCVDARGSRWACSSVIYWPSCGLCEVAGVCSQASL
jgi:hypothetical protein